MSMLLALMILFPLVGAALNGLILRNRVSKTVSHVVGAVAMILSACCAVGVYMSVAPWVQAEPTIFRAFDWIKAGDFEAPMRFIVDPLSGLMILVVTVIGSLIHIYAGGYMHE